MYRPRIRAEGWLIIKKLSQKTTSEELKKFLKEVVRPIMHAAYDYNDCILERDHFDNIDSSLESLIPQLKGWKLIEERNTYYEPENDLEDAAAWIDALCKKIYELEHDAGGSMQNGIINDASEANLIKGLTSFHGWLTRMIAGIMRN
jgi:hypothetical protein